jgi:hypothetical protein
MDLLWVADFVQTLKGGTVGCFEAQASGRIHALGGTFAICRTLHLRFMCAG